MKKKTTSILLIIILLLSYSAKGTNTILDSDKLNINENINYPLLDKESSEKINFAVNVNLYQKLNEEIKKNLEQIKNPEEQEIIYLLKKGLSQPKKFKVILLNVFNNLFSKEAIICGTLIMSLGIIYKILTLETVILIIQEGAKTWRWKIVADTINHVTNLVKHLSDTLKHVVDKVENLFNLKAKLMMLGSYLTFDYY